MQICGCLFLTMMIAAGGEPSVSPRELAVKIDERLAAALKESGVLPAPVGDDATFFRRVHLDFVGRIPSVAEVRDFLAESGATDKRERRIVQLTKSPNFDRHQATFWRRTWLPQTDTPQFASLIDESEDWLADRLGRREPYEKIVRDLLVVRTGDAFAGSTTSSSAMTAPAMQVAAKSNSGRAATPQAFLAASEFKPENLAANSTQAFLGINLDCAQCHDHPFARWKRDEFWQTAAFFVRPSAADVAVAAALEVEIPGSKQKVAARYLNGVDPKLVASADPDVGRRLLADWIVAKENPYFARNAVNRVWANMMGTGLIEPLDDVSADDKASHPELLAELTQSFIDSNFDLRFLMTAIAQSNAYQRSAVGARVESSVAANEETPIDPQLFAQMPVRALTGEQLYDSLRVASGLPPERDDLDRHHAMVGRRRFAERFRVDRPATAERSILQALALMNGEATAEWTSAESSRTVIAVAEAPFLNDRGRIETIYLATLGRLPSSEEEKEIAGYLESHASAKDRRRAIANVFWALLNCSEFNTNH